MCEELIKTNVDFLLTETTLDPKISAQSIVTVLRERKTTGELVFNLSEGGIQRILLREKTKADEEESERLRQVMGMNAK